MFEPYGSKLLVMKIIALEFHWSWYIVNVYVFQKKVFHLSHVTSS